MTAEELRVRLAEDCVLFFGFYLQDELTMRVPDFHLEIWSELVEFVKQQNTEGAEHCLRKLFAVPREHAKSTIVKLATILFLRYSPLKFVIYVSKTQGVARNAIHDILNWLQSPQEEALFGAPTRVRTSETDGLWVYDIGVPVDNGTGLCRKRIILKAAGMDTQIRGTLISNTRPQVAILDDIEDLDNTTPLRQPKLDAAFAAMLKAFDSQRHVIIHIGNMINDGTLLARNSKSPSWNPTVFGALVRNRDTGKLRPLWEGKYTTKGLLKEYAEFRRLGAGHMWESEMMNLSRDDIMRADFSGVRVVPQPVPEQLEAGFICLDPAFGLEAHHDYSAITVHAQIHGESTPTIIDESHGRWGEDELFNNMLDLSYRWGIRFWCVESVAAQKLLLPLFRLMFLEQGLDESQFQIVALSLPKKSKAERIMVMRSAIGRGDYSVSQGAYDVVDLFQEYHPDAKEHDDVVDSCSMGLTAWAVHGEAIQAHGIGIGVGSSTAVGSGEITPESYVARI